MHSKARLVVKTTNWKWGRIMWTGSTQEVRHFSIHHGQQTDRQTQQHPQPSSVRQHGMSHATLQVTLFTQNQLRSTCPGKSRIPHTPQPPCSAAYPRQDVMHISRCHCPGCTHFNAFFLCLLFLMSQPSYTIISYVQQRKDLKLWAVI